MCLPSTFWRTERRTVVIPMMSQLGCLELLITRTFLSGPVKFEITRVDCSLHFEGWIEIDVKASPTSESILVPFLVTESYIDTPILGYNVITALDQEDLLSVFAKYDKKKEQSVASVFGKEQDGDMGLV